MACFGQSSGQAGLLVLWPSRLACLLDCLLAMGRGANGAAGDDAGSRVAGPQSQHLLCSRPEALSHNKGPPPLRAAALPRSSHDAARRERALRIDFGLFRCCKLARASLSATLTFCWNTGVLMPGWFVGRAACALGAAACGCGCVYGLRSLLGKFRFRNPTFACL